MPERIQLSRRKGWRKPENTVVVARPSKWGNPFRIVYGKEAPKAPIWWHVLGPRDSWSYLSGPAYARRVATDEFRNWLLADLRPRDWHWTTIEKQQWMRAALDAGELTGKNLACWCPLDQPCHADVLLELANGADS
jgi:hypothetical protein